MSPDETSDAIRKSRRLAGLTQAQVAKKARMSRPRFALYEAGHVEISPDELERVRMVISGAQKKRGHAEVVLPAELRGKRPEDMTEEQRGIFVQYMASDQANRLKFYRIDAGLSQHEVARQIGVSQSRLSQWEVGKITPTDEELTRWYQVIFAAEAAKTADYLKSERLIEPAVPVSHTESALFNLNTLGRLLGDVPPLKPHTETMERLIENQSKLIELYSSLTAEKDARILELEKQVADLRALYEAEMEAALAYDKARDLREKLSVPIPDDVKK